MGEREGDPEHEREIGRGTCSGTAILGGVGGWTSIVIDEADLETLSLTLGTCLPLDEGGAGGAAF